jgi:hypothetical protein
MLEFKSIKGKYCKENIKTLCFKVIKIKNNFNKIKKTKFFFGLLSALKLIDKTKKVKKIIKALAFNNIKKNPKISFLIIKKNKIDVI